MAKIDETRALFTPELLAELFDYRPATGTLIRRATGAEVVSVNNYGYRWAWVWNHALLAHRVAWRMQTGEWPVAMVDHIDGCKTNNAWANLRLADHSLNAMNVFKAPRTNKVGLLGVNVDRRNQSRPYRAAIQRLGRKISLGTYVTAEEAHEAYLAAKRIHHAEIYAERRPC